MVTLFKKAVYICPECRRPVDRSKPYHGVSLCFHESCWKARLARTNRYRQSRVSEIEK